MAGAKQESEDSSDCDYNGMWWLMMLVILMMMMMSIKGIAHNFFSFVNLIFWDMMGCILVGGVWKPPKLHYLLIYWWERLHDSFFFSFFPFYQGCHVCDWRQNIVLEFCWKSSHLFHPNLPMWLLWSSSIIPTGYRPYSSNFLWLTPTPGSHQ